MRSAIALGIAACGLALAPLVAQEPRGFIAGRVTSATGQPIPGATVSATVSDVIQNARTDARGRYSVTVSRGRYPVHASAPGYARSGYGEVGDLGPTIVRVRAGETIPDINLTLRGGATIAGRVIDKQQAPVVGATVVALVGRWLYGERQFIAGARSRAETDGRGEFRIGDLEPGEYVVVAMAGPAATFRPSAALLEGARRVTVGSAQALTDVTVHPIAAGAGSLPGEVLDPRHGATVTGRLNVMRASVSDITLSPIRWSNPAAGPFRGRPTSSGEVTITGITPGRYRWLRTPEASHQLSIFEGTSTLDLADLPFDVKAGDPPRELRFELTGGGFISGTITAADGKPTTAGGVIVAATDPRYWNGVSRRLLVTRADQYGFFEAARMPVGEYFVAHVAQLAPGQLWDAAFLRKALAGAARVKVTRGAEQTVNLRLK